MSASPVLHMNQNDLFNLITGHTVKKMRGKSPVINFGKM